jgi:hypothetical protein
MEAYKSKFQEAEQIESREKDAILFADKWAKRIRKEITDLHFFDHKSMRKFSDMVGAYLREMI